ncbi:MAG: exodeoxyribonuclease V subunit alpha [Jatrophihabitans sp.]
MTRLAAVRARGLLAAFDAAGVLAPADVHVARRLGALTGETGDRVLLAVALTVRGTRHGSVVCDLAAAAQTITPDPDAVDETVPPADLPWPEARGWVEACAVSPIVLGTAGGPPVQMVGSRLWLDRYWRQEVQVAEDLLRRSDDRPADIDPALLRADLDALFPGDTAPDQRLAVATSALSRVSVIAGGPGTGKTTTVAQLITVLLRRLGPSLRVALAAPTGKAAARLEEAVHSAIGELTADDRAALARLSASTLHRLLGWRPGTSSRFEHDRGNHLPFDVVVVDESSMVPLTLMARLLEALAPGTRLVLVGDPDQLASVEAGAVLGDLVDEDDVGPLTSQFRAVLSTATDGLSPVERPDGTGARLRESVVGLRTVHRFAAGGPIAELAALARAGHGEGALALLRAGPPGLVFHEVSDDAPVSGDAVAEIRAAALAHERAVIDAARAGDCAAALDALGRHRLLCAHRAGPRGVRHWTESVERWLAPDLGTVPRADGRYAGQALLVTANDYEIELYNGDCGVVVRRGDDLVASFRRGSSPTETPLVRLGAVGVLHAMTVHRAQGSQFDSVTVLLPLARSPLATRQTFYTAITRAAREVRLIGSAEAVVASIHRPIARATGLRARLTGPLVPIAVTGAYAMSTPKSRAIPASPEV